MFKWKENGGRIKEKKWQNSYLMSSKKYDKELGTRLQSGLQLLFFLIKEYKD